jgi:cellulose synthase/poly-beta-1,6-N-acetylglucosamine synthase-like glycosyltransferase
LAETGPEACFVPLISVHVATHDEPPEMVTAAPDALAIMEYPNFEVLMIDDNTPAPAPAPAPARWQPVKKHIKRLGQRFTFIHRIGVSEAKASEWGLYVDKEVGRGLLPLDLVGLRLQRSRWVKGNFQTLLSTLCDWHSLRSRKGKSAVAAQLTAWTGFLALALLTLTLLVVLQMDYQNGA